ncbi:MAG: 1-acyl-sn-glycerol-3-phosphate acyltransferase, partial [Bradymonadaceae bacterium]
CASVVWMDVMKYLAATLFDAAGWTVRNEVPEDLETFVVIGAPHTSNWDLVVTLAVAATVDIEFSWVGKRTLFQGPYGSLMRWLGGISVDRRKSQGAVQQLAETLRRADRMALVIAPEGTRSRSDRWKSGFYHIAREADVPIVMGYVDYARRDAGLGPTIDPVGSKDQVEEQLQAFYGDKKGLYPDQFTRPILS